MNTRVKSQKDKALQGANHGLQTRESSQGAAQLVDNRPNTDALAALQEGVNASPQVQQLQAYQAMASSCYPPQPPLQKKENQTGLPDTLKSGIENLSGYSMDDVKVHYNSNKPAQLNAHAYAQGSNIHVASGQEKHLPHEAWHVVQQKQGRVQPTFQMKGKVSINDDQALEREADAMGAKALQCVSKDVHQKKSSTPATAPVQRMLYYASNSDRKFTSVAEIHAFFKGATEPKVSEAELVAAFESDRLYYVNFRGSILGHYGYQILGIEEYTARPAIAGRGTLGVVADAGPAGFSITGRPAWTEETIEKLAPIKFRDNIRHIIPYHMIRDGFMTWLNEVFTRTGGALASVKAEVMRLAGELGLGVDPSSPDTLDVIQQVCGEILHKLNNVPGNLWAGDKVENQRLNTLRERIRGIKAAILRSSAAASSSAASSAASGAAGASAVPDTSPGASAVSDTSPGALACEELSKSIQRSDDRIYREILEGALHHFPQEPGERSAMSGERVEEILNLLKLSGEIDAMPSSSELGRFDVDGQERYIQNLPDHFHVLALYQEGDMEEAMKCLVGLRDPYT